MRYLFSLLLLIISLPASTENWQTVSMPNICTFQMPNTMEIQAGQYKIVSDKLQRQILELPIDSTRVIAQQKGLNEYSKKSFKVKKYARIIVETDYGQIGDYNHIDTKLTATKFELRELDGIYRAEMEKVFSNITAKGKMSQKLLIWYPLKIVNINGISMINISYTRSVNNGKPVLVNVYAVENNDRYHRVTISYRVDNAANYEEDLKQFIYTFKINRR